MFLKIKIFVTQNHFHSTRFFRQKEWYPKSIFFIKKLYMQPILMEY